MIKYILVTVIAIAGIIYEAWNQRKIRDAEWYEKDFRNKVLSFMAELRTEPENTRRMLRKLAFDDLETQLKKDLQDAREAYNREICKSYGEQDAKRESNLAGRIDALNDALSYLNASKPKSYKESYMVSKSDPTMPKELYEIYMNSASQLMDDLDKQLELDKEWKERKKK